MHIQSRLVEGAQAAESRGSTFCLLIDSAQAEGAHAALDNWKASYHSLFDATPEAGLLEIAPLLVPLTGLNASTRERVAAWVQKLAHAAPCVSWFESAVPPEPLAKHLRRYHVVGLSEGQSMLVRWYDTRILPVWLSCLTLTQAEAFTTGITTWQYVDRFGETASLPAGRPREPSTTFPAEPSLGRPMLTLDDTQYAMLLDAGDTDVLVRHLRRVIPDELAKVPPRQLFAFVSRYQQEAAKAGVDDIDRQTQYVLLALYTSGLAMQHPLVKQFMKAPPRGLQEFVDALQALPDEVWDAGTPLWADTRVPAR